MKESDVRAVVGPKQETVRTRKGDLVLRELTIEDISMISAELMELVASLSAEQMKDKSGTAIVLQLIAQGKLTALLKHILASMTGKPKEEFDGLTLWDFKKILLAFLRLNPVSELKSLFFDLKEAVQPPPTNSK